MGLARGVPKLCKRIATQERDELGVPLTAALDVHMLAERHGVLVLDTNELKASGIELSALESITNGGDFSAASIPYRNGSFILHNASHDRVRQRSNLAHELGHILLEHKSDLRIVGEGKGCRQLDRTLEDEANYLSGELLIPYDAAFAAARMRLTDQQVASQYEVSVKFASMRMYRSGARKYEQRLFGI